VKFFGSGVGTYEYLLYNMPLGQIYQQFDGEFAGRGCEEWVGMRQDHSTELENSYECRGS